jgi:hypothetical protein
MEKNNRRNVPHELFSFGVSAIRVSIYTKKKIRIHTTGKTYEKAYSISTSILFAKNPKSFWRILNTR